jgi:hypothetical protein
VAVGNGSERYETVWIECHEQKGVGQKEESQRFLQKYRNSDTLKISTTREN